MAWERILCQTLAREIENFPRFLEQPPQKARFPPSVILAELTAERRYEGSVPSVSFYFCYGIFITRKSGKQEIHERIKNRPF